MTPSDRKRRATQRAGVMRALNRGRWLSLKDFQGVKGSDSGISARIRDARKPKFGGHKIVCRRDEGGVYRYKLVR